MSLLVPAYPGCPGSKAVKWSLLLLLLYIVYIKCSTKTDIVSIKTAETVGSDMASINTTAFNSFFKICVHMKLHTHPFNGPFSGTTRGEPVPER